MTTKRHLRDQVLRVLLGGPLYGSQVVDRLPDEDSDGVRAAVRRLVRDRAQVDLCDQALAAHETADAQGGDLIGPDGAIWTRTEAREACADAINAGQGW